MRELKYGDAPDEQRDAVAQALREAGRRAEAILLYEGRPEATFLREEETWAVGEGHAFHLLALKRMGRTVSEQSLRDCARAAEQRGRWMDARNCYLALEDEVAIEKISEHLPPGMRVEPEIEEDQEP